MNISDWGSGTNFLFSQNELSIDDDILTYNTRSTKFINFKDQHTFYFLKSLSHFEIDGVEEIDPDVIHMFGI